MRKFFVVILLVLLITNFTMVSSSEYKCKGMHTPIVDSKRVRVDDEQLTERQMIITTEMINRNSTSHNQTFYDTVTKLLELNVRFFSDLLTIIPRYPEDMIFDTCCPSFSSQGNNIKYDSDLHVFVEINTFHNYSVSNDLQAFSESCKVIHKVGTTHGMIYLNQNKLQNESPHIVNLIIQHEFLHLLGFFITDLSQFNSTNLSYEIIDTQDEPLVIVTSPEVKQIVQNYIGCKKLNGYPLETIIDNSENKAKIILDGHWYPLSQSELMDEHPKHDQTIFSHLSAAYLNATGFYTKVNQEMAQELLFVQNKGCSIFNLFRNTTTNEVCPKVEESQTCKFYEFLPFCSSYYEKEYHTDFFIENESEDNKRCFLLKNHTITIDESMKDSKEKKIQPYEVNVHYLESSCSANNHVEVIFKDSYYNCVKDKQEIYIIDGNITLICPDRLSEFCNGNYHSKIKSHSSSFLLTFYLIQLFLVIIQ